MGRCEARAVELDKLAAPEPGWSHSVAEMVYFSPRGHDLDGDRALEIVASGGREVPPMGKVVALDAATGSLRWQVSARQQLYGSPVFLDVTLDGADDVFVGGRNKEFLAIDGESGELLWRFPHEGVSAPDGWYNFYTAVIVEDQTGDGLPDLLVANGGADGFEPYQPRPPGHLLVLDSADGSILASAGTPDRAETYMSPLLLPDAETESPTLLFGTGGETRPGGLYKTTLQRVLEGDLSGATPLLEGDVKGVIAPPALADFNQDGRLDIVVATFDGRLVALDGVNDTVLWQQTFADSETYSTPTLGFFDDDDVPDVFAVFLQGEFPDYSSATRALVSGRDGSKLWEQADGDFAMAGDVAVDLNADGIDEVIFVANDTSADVDSQQQLYLLDTKQRRARAWGPPLGAALPASPWAGDLNGDGCLELVVSHRHVETDKTTSFLTELRVDAPASNVRWSGYLGTRFDSTLTR